MDPFDISAHFDMTVEEASQRLDVILAKFRADHDSLAESLGSLDPLETGALLAYAVGYIHGLMLDWDRNQGMRAGFKGKSGT